MEPAARSSCPIASSLNLFGDRWTLVIVRDMFVGKTRFAEFLASSERITTSVLADRLEKMEAAGLTTKTAYQQHPPRFEYRLTEMGKGLLLPLQALCSWGNQYLPGTMYPPMGFMDMKLY
jgi:DNA-binding HxlR family transcriptional regulator